MNRRKLILGCSAAWVLVALLFIPKTGYAGTLHPGYLATDTVPPVQQPPAETDKKKSSTPPVPDVVKQVPKSRRQVKPAALPPVRVTVPVKPRIIKPQIRRVKGLIQ